MVQNVVSPHSGVPLYQQVAALLRKKISTHEYAPGSLLPAEQTMSSEYLVGRDAVRDALAVLRGEGLIETRRGFRTRVREHPQREKVRLAPGDVVCSRMPTPEEKQQHDVPEGVPMLVVGKLVYPADRYELVV